MLRKLLQSQRTANVSFWQCLNEIQYKKSPPPAIEQTFSKQEPPGLFFDSLLDKLDHYHHFNYLYYRRLLLPLILLPTTHTMTTTTTTTHNDDHGDNDNSLWMMANPDWATLALWRGFEPAEALATICAGVFPLCVLAKGSAPADSSNSAMRRHEAAVPSDERLEACSARVEPGYGGRVVVGWW